ncbi:MAG: ribonuclease HII [Chitinophagaceae bacterium]|nr:MAG: ribonuclease HII [Chitinophagaceae bacterium]
MLKAYYHKTRIEAGIDEAGRGCYAGPVTAAAVILPKKFKHPLLNDSKQLTKEQRDLLRPIIEERAICWSVAMICNNEIDRINILQATFSAMHECVSTLSVIPEHLLIDGNRFRPYQNISHDCIIQGDGTYASIAAASVLAKTHRDQYMQQLHEEFPHYDWVNNKGYGTRSHRTAIEQHGLCKYHRRSFRIDPQQFELDFSEEELERRSL